MHISPKLRQSAQEKKPTFSFEFFPPKTAQGVQNLYDRMDRMHAFGPTFIDVTWGAGGRLSHLTCEMVKVAQSVYGLETCMHLTCTDMPKSKIDEALKEAYNAGCTNILALRGDPPREKEKWTAVSGGFRYAKDLIKYIKDTYGDHFDIGVAGYPEGCDDHRDQELLIEHLKEKIDAGGTFVVTQMFYNADIFIDWVKKCRAVGIDVPIVPGIMPIQTHAAFLRRAQWTQCDVPDHWTKALEPVKNDDAAVREVGKGLIAELCRKLMDAGIYHLHFYTMNLAQSTKMVLDELEIMPHAESPLEKPLPWRQSLGLNRRDENVRPIFWRNRNRSYIARTQDWDEFPNGRWGDSRSPAYGELDRYGIGLKGTNEQNRKIWGHPTKLRDVCDLFSGYIQGKVASLPWSESPISSEADVLTADLVDLNKRGLFTVNSQPPVDGAKSNHPVYGWGPRNGYVYQKAYLEVLVCPELIAELITRIEREPEITYFAVNDEGDLKTNSEPDSGPNALTWGVFPGKEIVQPTIVETVSFLAWKDEFFRLGHDWSSCYDNDDPGRYLIAGMMKDWYLVNIVHNDFRRERGIFPLFDGLEVPGLDESLTITSDVLEQYAKTRRTSMTNGTNGTNGHSSPNGTQTPVKPEVNGLKN
ncbi:methylenetetrahydrofolate reductase 2 [Myriangium duriaei CBS 260.36]|uniref:Methylenetetrahydrofolate reductase 2 n=1 Tax=Myriangium duriaei CBS 260.36 TaxID=1168546 RepID=A0A9P4IY39_9PEZI|nr:methylenetetrahydrofolate reductase 2 [Myriangium duriaei CBS 260.36]